MNRKIAALAGVSTVLVVGFLAGRLSIRKSSAPTLPSRRVLYYVDPMHPAYRSDKPGIAPDCGMALEPVYEGESKALPTSLPAGGVALTEDRQRMVGIQVAVATHSNGVRTVRTTGRIVAEDNRVYRIQAGFEGWVDSLADTPTGTLVKQEQILATLYGPEVRSAALNYIGFMSGVERVKQGLSQGDMKSIEESKRVNEEQLKLLGMGDKQIDEIATTHRAASSINLVSPADGLIVSRAISPHQRFEKGAELVRIADLSKVWVVADIHGTEGDLRPGTRVTVKVPELDKILQATVTSSVPLFDDASRTLKVRLEADNPGLQLRPDMFVDVEFQSKVPEGLAIPTEAVLDSGMRKIVYVETADNVFEPRTVEVSHDYGDEVLIHSGISEGDRVAVAGNFLLDSESRMRSAASAPSTKASTGMTNAVGDRPAEPAKLTAMTGTQSMLIHDPVCGMALSKGDIKFQEHFAGKTYSFCSDSCRKKFLADPDKFATRDTANNSGDEKARPHD